MSLFNLSNNQVIIEPAVLSIPEFKVLWDRDTSKTKDSAQRELSYVYFLTDFNSPYSNVPDFKRQEVVIEDFIKDKTWTPDNAIEQAISKYKLLTETASMRLVLATRRTLDKLSHYMDQTELDSRTVKIIIDTVKNVSSVLNAYGKMEEVAQKDQKQSGRMIGGKELGIFEK